MTEEGFLTKLYSIKPFKMVQSPQLNKCHSAEEAQEVAPPPLVHMQSLREGRVCTPTKEPSGEMFSSLSSSIDHLFSKIEKIKEEFECELSNSNRKGMSSRKKPTPHKPNKENQVETHAFQLKSPPSHPLKTTTNQVESYRPLDSYVQEQKQSFNIEQPRPIPPDSPSLQISDFQLGICIGSGKFGDVHICRHRQTGTIYALKKIFKSTLQEYNMINQFILELKIHYQLNHPHIIKLYTHFHDEYHIFLLMEYADSGQLMQHLSSSEKFVSRTISQVLEAVEYLHQHNVLHRDIKPENIVIVQEQMKLCDFGWAAMFDNEMKKTFCGTLDYVSPEMKDKGQYTVSVDLWSIGVLTFELLSGFPPYKHQIDKWKLKGSKRDLKWNWSVLYPPHISDTAKNFIQKLLRENPNDRASIRECQNHPFIVMYREDHSETMIDVI